MVDLFGRPSCADCFDNCLKRDHPATPKKNRGSTNNSPNVGARLSSSYGGKSKEGSPIIEELEQRFGIVRSRENTPVLTESGRLIHSSPIRSVSVQGESPKLRRHTNLGDNPNAESSESPSSFSRRRTHSVDFPSQHSMSPIIRRTPEHRIGLMSGSESQNGTQSPDTSALDLTDLSMVLFKESSPSRSSRTSNVQAGPFASSDAPPSTKINYICDRCDQPILNHRQGGHFVTIPGTDENDSPKLYHNDCFKCSVCKRLINDSKKGQASFVLASVGPCHIQVSL
jgi:hypothetical protein